MRLVFTWIEHLRTLTDRNMTAFAAAVVAQFQEVISTANTWARADHRSDGTHRVVRLNIEVQPVATPGQLTLYYDGGDLKVVFPNGTTGTVTIV
jgi:hypothetical protein